MRLGERLLRDMQITPDQLQIALHEQRRSGERLGGVLLKLNFISDSDLTAALAAHTGCAAIDLKKTVLDPDLVRALPRAVALRCRVLPIALEGDRLHLAMADPHDIAAIDETRRHFPRHIEITPMVASPIDIADCLADFAPSDAEFDAILGELQGLVATNTHEANAWHHPVVRLVNSIVTEAVRDGASDIHLEPEGTFVRLRLRVDGVLRQIRALHREHWPELSHRLKIMAGMNIADTRSMQDGRFHMQIGGAEIDFRMAVMPTVQGENIVIRILDHRRALLPLEKLGYDAAALAQMDSILQRPEGIVLVTGPTGSGKTTTLYAMLKRISRVELNVMTLEEPVEYQFDMIRQTAINEQQGMSFAEGVRGILRQAPDIIFIGEIRDDDTARMALRAAMTGHQVFSTLHCNDAFGALPRLNDLGLPSRMMAENIAGLVAQRLVRKLCPHCKQIRRANADENAIIARIQMPMMDQLVGGFAEKQSPIDAPVTLAEAVGCAHCHHSGYRGRLAVTEILRITPELDELIADDAPRGALRKQALADHFRPMVADGVGKVLRHETSLDELRRVVDMTRHI